jgi:hypothetical protein
MAHRDIVLEASIRHGIKPQHLFLLAYGGNQAQADYYRYAWLIYEQTEERLELYIFKLNHLRKGGNDGNKPRK